MPFAIFFLASLMLFAYPVTAAQDTLTNIRPAQTPGVLPALEPGRVIVLPNGEQGVIKGMLPDGNYETDIGLVITPQGVIVQGPGQGQSVTITPGSSQNRQLPVTPGEGQTGVENPVPEKAKAEGPESSTSSPETARKETPKQESTHDLTLAELLPLTEIPEKKSPETNKAEKPEVKAEGEKKKTEPKKETKNPENKNKEKQAPHKTPIGQELRIPPDAAKKGSLEFLEGCWQGTRPEYYSKRTIRECFCFGANGSNGKRRVFDPLGHRTCIGATRAHLSSSGVLSVTSEGAACSDGERWGSAEMVCRNSGPRTPCSWVFRDANNGRQSYEIPFVRVESCGR